MRKDTDKNQSRKPKKAKSKKQEPFYLVIIGSCVWRFKNIDQAQELVASESTDSDVDIDDIYIFKALQEFQGEFKKVNFNEIKPIKFD